MFVQPIGVGRSRGGQEGQRERGEKHGEVWCGGESCASEPSTEDVVCVV